MPLPRPVISSRSPRATLEGAGVRLQRAFGEVHARLDPFLLLDHFGSRAPEDYRAGFPWHPHRGMETITYMLSGEVLHGDSLGNRGRIGPGQVQWMTAGAGIVHEEMPQPSAELEGFQLWCNLPARQKMMPPRYRELRAEDIVDFELGPGVRVRLVAGELAGRRGPVQDVVADPLYADLELSAGARIEIPLPPGHSAFAYLFRGAAVCSGPGGETQSAPRLAVLGDGDHFAASAGPQGARLLLVAGRPLREPVAWGGPIVMNTQAELDLAFRQYAAGTFLQQG